MLDGCAIMDARQIVDVRLIVDATYGGATRWRVSDYGRYYGRTILSVRLFLDAAMSMRLSGHLCYARPEALTQLPMAFKEQFSSQKYIYLQW
jgi:hypothetical protein